MDTSYYRDLVRIGSVHIATIEDKHRSIPKSRIDRDRNRIDRIIGVYVA